MLGVPLLAVVLGLFGGHDVSTTRADDNHPGLTPALVEADIVPGGSLDVEKTVHTPEIPPKPDIYFLSDTTGSMTTPIAAVKASASAVLASISGSDPSALFGVGEYKDFPDDPEAYVPLAPIGGAAAATAAIGTWAASGGSDGSEAQLYALSRIADPTDPEGIGFRTDSSKIIVWFGDCPGHDPVPALASTGVDPVPADITEVTTTADLVAGGFRVVAISTGTGCTGDLDGDPVVYGGDYTLAYGIVENGSVGQASRIAAATGGVHILAATPDEVVAAILAGLHAVSVEVSMATDCADPISVSFVPASRTVVSGEHAVFIETISVDPLATQGVTYECDDWALIDGNPMTVTDAAGETKTILEEKKIYVPDVVPPEAACEETVNPHGKKVPPAGSTTPPGPKGGQNEDGFYELTATDEIDPNPQIFVLDTGSGAVFGPFSHEDKIKYTEAPDATPESKKMGSGKGQAGAIAAHIIGNGDAAMYAVDWSGNVSDHVLCLVPPLPK